MKSKRKIKTGVVILAAGRGTRMRESRTISRGGIGEGNHPLPKVLVPVSGVPMILRVINSVERANFGVKPVVVIGYRGDLVRQAVGERAQYARQRHQLGTGHAVAATKSLLYKKVDEVLVIYGDHPFTSPSLLRCLAKLRQRTKAVVAMTTVIVPNFLGPRRIFLRYGHIVRDSSGRLVKRCVEFKDATMTERRIREVNSGHYCFDAQWLWQSLPKLKRKNSKNEYYLTDLIGLAVAEGRRVVPLALKNWREGIGVNTIQEVRVAELILMLKSQQEAVGAPLVE